VGFQGRRFRFAVSALAAFASCACLSVILCGCFVKTWTPAEIAEIPEAVTIDNLDKFPTPKQSFLPECGPCVVQAILGYFGDLDGTDRRDLWRDLQTDVEQGTKAKHIVSYARARGHAVTLFNGSIKELKRFVNANCPFIVGVIIEKAGFGRLLAHYKVAVGYVESAEKESVITYDSSAGGFLVEDKNDFLKQWDYFGASLIEVEDALAGMGIDPEDPPDYDEMTEKQQREWDFPKRPPARNRANVRF